MLLSGESKQGKTRAAFSIARAVLERTDKKVYYICCDNKAGKFLKYVEPHLDSRFFIRDAADIPTTRDAYRLFRSLWQHGDWQIIDRADLIWVRSQTYVRARYSDLSEDELDEMFLEWRAGQKKQAKTKEDKEKLQRQFTQGDLNNLDWAIIRGEHNNIVENLCLGPEAVDKQVNVVLTALAKPLVPQFDKLDDPRTFASMGVALEGEKNMLSLVDTHIHFHQDPSKGYVFTSLGDVERLRAFKEPVTNFIDDYEKVIGERIIQ